MPVEFIGMIGTKNESEIRLTAGPVIDSDYVKRFARAHEDAGFDRVLIGYSSSRPDGTQVAAYAAAHTERLGFLVAHRPGFVAPTLAARTFATLDQFTGGRIAVHIITGGSDAEQRRDGDHLSKDERYDRTDEYLDILKQAWTAQKPFSLPGQPLPDRGLLLRGPLPAASEDQALLRRLLGRRLPGRRQARRHLRPVGRAPGGDEGADRLGQTPPPRRRAAATIPGISVSFRPILGPTEELAWERPTGSWRRPRRTPRASGARRRRETSVLGGAAPSNVGSQRLLAAAEKGELHDRALWTPLAAATGAAGNSTALVGTPETVAQAILDYLDIGVTTILIRGYDPLQRRHRLRPPPAAAGPRRRSPGGTPARMPPRSPRPEPKRGRPGRRCGHDRAATAARPSAHPVPHRLLPPTPRSGTHLTPPNDCAIGPERVPFGSRSAPPHGRSRGPRSGERGRQQGRRRHRPVAPRPRRRQAAPLAGVRAPLAGVLPASRSRS